MRVEAVGNAYLAPAARLTDESLASMVAMGWHAPTFQPDDESGEPTDGSPNFFLDAARPVPYGQLAALAVRTLREIFRVGHPGLLKYMAGCSAEKHVSIRFPSLGIKREVRA